MTEQQKNPAAVYDALKTFEKNQDPEHVKYMGARSVEDLSTPASSSVRDLEKQVSNTSLSPSSATAVSPKLANDDVARSTAEHKVSSQSIFSH